jgi:hypothetical protein
MSQIENLNSPEGRKQKLIKLFGYLGLAAITGATLMYFLPRYLDSLYLHDVETFGATIFYFSFIVFINIHHYFIDNVIWRGKNDDIKKYLYNS